jgi:hypothetical protein
VIGYTYIMIDVNKIEERFLMCRDHLDERTLRLYVASEALAIGRGGIAAVSRATGVARSTIGRGLKDLEGPVFDRDGVRRKGAGRPCIHEADPALLECILEIVEPNTMGDPMRVLRWVSKSHEKIADALTAMGKKVSPSTVRRLLPLIGYSRQVNKKTYEGGDHPDRNAQFEHINTQAASTLQNGNPVISVDTKKKEPIGDFRNIGTDYRPKGSPDKVRVHDFVDKNLGKAVPYGVYDVGTNSAWVSVGVDNDTAEFAVNAIRKWWYMMGKERYPDANEIMVTADCGGSNGSRVRLWKRELQTLADELQIDIKVSHYPPGTSKWNKIEHRLFCHITQNWRGRPLTSRMAIVELISATTTKTGLIVRSAIDTNTYQKGITVPTEDFENLNITRHEFRPEWNYTISPGQK